MIVLSQSIQESEVTGTWVSHSGLQLPTLILHGERQDAAQQPDVENTSCHSSSRLHNVNPPEDYATDDLSRSLLSDIERLCNHIGVLDKEVNTLDVGRQAVGPKWTMRQYSLWWKDRSVRDVLTPDDPGGCEDSERKAAAGTAVPRMSGMAPDGPAAASEAAAAAIGLSASSSHGERGGGEMDDEADSAWVHQG
jgi:hypothetical protein